MDECMLLDLIDAHSSRILMVEEMVSTVHEVTSSLAEDLEILHRERDHLRVDLREMAARNCSFRKKDFDNFMNRLFDGVDKERDVLITDSQEIELSLRKYLKEQIELTLTLKTKVYNCVKNTIDKKDLECFVDEMKGTYQKNGDDVFQQLCKFQYKIQCYKKTMLEWNNSMRRLLERSSSLEMKDMRQLETIKNRFAREQDRDLRREEVRVTLGRFKDERSQYRIEPIITRDES